MSRDLMKTYFYKHCDITCRQSSLFRKSRCLMIICFIIFLTSCQSSNIIKQSKVDNYSYQEYVDPFIYQIGAKSWNSVSEIDPDDFVVFYISLLGSGKEVIPDDLPVDKIYGNPLIPEELLEESVLNYFATSPQIIRTSKYYNPDDHAYWTGGIGSTIDIHATRVDTDNDFKIIYYTASITTSNERYDWEGSVVIQIDTEHHYKYISHKRTEAISASVLKY